MKNIRPYHLIESLEYDDFIRGKTPFGILLDAKEGDVSVEIFGDYFEGYPASDFWPARGPEISTLNFKYKGIQLPVSALTEIALQRLKYAVLEKLKGAR